MSWREKLVVKILLLVARVAAETPELEAEIKTLAIHIEVNAPKPEPAATLTVATSDSFYQTPRGTERKNA